MQHIRSFDRTNSAFQQDHVREYGVEITIDDAGVHDAQHAGNCVDENPRELAQQLLIAAEARAAEVRVE